MVITIVTLKKTQEMPPAPPTAPSPEFALCWQQAAGASQSARLLLPPQMDHRIALTSTSAVAFNVSKRKSQDLGFGALYLLLLLATLGFAAYGASKADLNNLRDAGCGLFAPPSPPAIGASPPSPPTVDFSGDLKIIAESWYIL